MKHAFAAGLLLLCVASPARAQLVVDGTWTGTIVPRANSPVLTMVLKTEGETVTGTISDFKGGVQRIEDGLIQGDTLSFFQTLDFGGSEFELYYSAVAKGGGLLFRLELPAVAPPRAFVMKRAP
jgi:hypothetical protein